MPGYFQPVEIRAPQGASISLAVAGTFEHEQPAPVLVGLLVGQVYRFRVTNIPLAEGRELFPTLEIIDRLYPPCGQEARFPIPIELTADELRLALDGHLVTRVIYIEDPKMALPQALKRDEQPWFDAGPGTNPLLVADTLGRPMAILRIGGRLPADGASPEPSFLGQCPPVLKFRRPVEPTLPPQEIQYEAQRPQRLLQPATFNDRAGSE
ncbi:MAG: hypothetical protein K1X74_04055 [Pirellulales bacterium]|nr:hypothetical protein [Pirellulales bacterium]